MHSRIGDIPHTHIRAFPVGAEVTNGGGVHFRVWAPGHSTIEVVLEHESPAAPGCGEAFALTSEHDGYFSIDVDGAHPGSLYRYRIDGTPDLYPDPASRCQPSGPHGPSCVVDAAAFLWSDAQWTGPAPGPHIIYELHLGTFTPEGTLAAAARELEDLAALGITLVELMPIAEFPGTFGWGYDGVDLFAPSHLYGAPEDYRRFIDRAHSLGIGVLLDVVYNHFGPDGNYLRAFTPSYFTDRHDNEWGEAINFDGADAAGVRELFCANAAYWIAEYHFDGFRFDATHQIHDASPQHILAEIARAVRSAAGAKRTLLIAEDNAQNVRHLRPEAENGFGFDAAWNDDLHHSLMVRLTGRTGAYYADYRGAAQELLSAVKRGYLYQGQRSAAAQARRGTPAFGVDRSRFVCFLQNHDQIAHSARGARVHTLASPELVRAAAALVMLAGGTPLLFQGQEFDAGAPFLYFADHTSELAALVAAGRKKFLAQFPPLATGEMQERLDDPSTRATFVRCKLDRADRHRNAAIYEFYQDLIRLRTRDPVLRAAGECGIDGAVVNDDAFAVRFFARDGADRLLIVNFGIDLHPGIVPEPLLAPPENMRWHVAWSSEDPKYGGGGVLQCEADDGEWFLPGHAAALLTPHKQPAVQSVM